METARDFYNFFAKIPDNRWIIGYLSNDRGDYCAVGWLRKTAGVASRWEDKLTSLFLRYIGAYPAEVNDGMYFWEDKLTSLFQAEVNDGMSLVAPKLPFVMHPKARILGALSYIIEQQEKEYRATAIQVWQPALGRVAKWNAVPVATLGMPELPVMAPKRELETAE